VTDVDQISLRVDRRSERDQLFARFSSSTRTSGAVRHGRLQETLVPGSAHRAHDRRNAGVSFTHVFNTKVLNELRVGWMRVNGGQVSVNRG